MSYGIRYQTRATAEYERAYKWYIDRSVLAAINFSSAVNDQIEIIAKNPERFRKTHKEFREVLLKKYPYCIIYLINETDRMVVIASIFHQKRNPKTKYRKLL
jgi:plasmid stabilization system protein ParE